MQDIGLVHVQCHYPIGYGSLISLTLFLNFLAGKLFEGSL